MMIRYCLIDSPIGTLTAVSEDGYLTKLHLCAAEPAKALREEDTVLSQTKEWLSRYFRGEQPEMEIPLKLRGTAFQQSVWALLQEIPYGETVTYGQLAATFGGKMSAQAVGQAIGKNPIAILVPCHRVLGAGGRLTGYSGGLDKKRFLLDLEQIKYR